MPLPYGYFRVARRHGRCRNRDRGQGFSLGGFDVCHSSCEQGADAFPLASGAGTYSKELDGWRRQPFASLVHLQYDMLALERDHACRVCPTCTRGRSIYESCMCIRSVYPSVRCDAMRAGLPCEPRRIEGQPQASLVVRETRRRNPSAAGLGLQRLGQLLRQPSVPEQRDGGVLDARRPQLPDRWPGRPRQGRHANLGVICTLASLPWAFDRRLRAPRMEQQQSIFEYFLEEYEVLIY